MHSRVIRAPAGGHLTPGIESINGAYEDVHWREGNAKAGEVTRYVRVRWDILLDAERESIFPREWLNGPPLSQVNWNTQMSGIKISAEVAAELEERWAEFLEGRDEKFSLFGGSLLN